MNNFTRQCAWCSQPFQTTIKNKIYCTRKCLDRKKDLRRRTKTNAPTYYLKVCRACKEQFMARRVNQIYCSGACAEYHKEQKRKETEQGRWKAAGKPLWKARIYYRDKGICQLCLKTIDLTIEYPNPISYSLDHKIPRSQGGTHNQSNLQAAHLICNSKRGNKPIGEWQ